MTEFEETQNFSTEYKEEPCEKSDKNLYPGINRILEGYVIVSSSKVSSMIQCVIKLYLWNLNLTISHSDRYAFGDIGKGYCPNDYRNILNATQCEIAAILLGFSYVNELDLDNVQPLRSASSCKFCGSCNEKTVSMANGDGNETVSICQWRYHGSN